MISTHDIRLRTLLALTGDAVLRAGACLTRRVLGVGTFAGATSNATCRTRTKHSVTLHTHNAELRKRCTNAINTCGAIHVRLLTRRTGDAARGARTKHSITLHALSAELRIRRARAIHTCHALGVRLLTGKACCASLMVFIDDIRRRTILALARCRERRARAANALGSISVWTRASSTDGA